MSGRSFQLSPTLSRGELLRVLSRLALSDRGWFLLASHCGLRVGESGRVRPAWRSGDSLHVHGKGSLWRVVPVPGDLLPEVLGLLDRDGRVVRFGVRSIQRHFRGLLVRSGVPLIGRTPHSLRLTSARHLIAQGGPLHAVRDLLGHSSLAVTSRYLHALEGDLVEAGRLAVMSHFLGKATGTFSGRAG